LLQLLVHLLEILLLLAVVAVVAVRVFQLRQIVAGLVAVQVKQQICLPVQEHQGKVMLVAPVQAILPLAAVVVQEQ